MLTQNASAGIASKRIPAARAKVATALRIALSSEPLSQDLIADVCRQLRIPPAEYRTLFRSTDDLMDVINAQLVAECAGRLARIVTDFIVPADASAALTAAARALASARPLDRGGILIRAERRLQSMRSPRTGEAVVHAERRFQVEVESTLVALMDKLGRPFVWEPRLAVRVVLDTYERSFESWLLRGGNESDFVTSSFVQTTLPQLLDELSSTRRSDELVLADQTRG